NSVITSGGTSMHVLPVFAFQEPREPGKHQQEQDHPHAQVAAFGLRRITDVVKEVDRVAHEAVELLGSHASLRKVLEALHGGTWAVTAATLAVFGQHSDL